MGETKHLDYLWPWTDPSAKSIQTFVGTAAAAAAESLQSCPTLCDPIDGSPPGSSIPGILQARTREWVAISFSCRVQGKIQMELCILYI